MKTEPAHCPSCGQTVPTFMACDGVLKYCGHTKTEPDGREAIKRAPKERHYCRLEGQAVR